MHAIDGMACAKRGCDNRGKLGLNIVGHGSFPTKWGRRWRYRCTVCGGTVSTHTGTAYSGLRCARRSGRREGYPSRPPTPPCVRFRTRRFKCSAADPGVESEGSGVPTPQASDCSRPHACARPPRSTRRLARWRWPCAHAQPQVPVRPFCDTESSVSSIAPTEFCGGAGESIDPVCRTGLSLWPGDSSQPILG